MNSIIIDKDKCTGCQICFKACWVDVFRWDDQGGKPIVAYPEDCVECNFCEISCPVNAINVVIDYDKPFPCSYIAGKV